MANTAVLNFIMLLTEATNLYDIRDKIIHFLHFEYGIDVPSEAYTYRPTITKIREVLKEHGASTGYEQFGFEFTHKVQPSKFDTAITCINHETAVMKHWSTRKDIDTCPYCN